MNLPREKSFLSQEVDSSILSFCYQIMFIYGVHEICTKLEQKKASPTYLI